MRPFGLLFILIFSFVTHSNIKAQFYNCKDDLIPKRDPQKKLVGYQNVFGVWEIIPFYDSARPFKEGMAVVSRRSKYGLINCDAKVILPINYEEIQDFSNGFTWVKQNGLWGLVNYQGKFVLPVQYQEVQNISKFSDHAWVKKDNLWGVFDKEKGSFIHPPQYSSWQDVSHTHGLVSIGDKKGLIDYSIKEPVIAVDNDKITKFAPYLLSVLKGDKYSVYNDRGKRLLIGEYDQVTNLGERRFSVSKEAKSAIYDYRGRRIVPFVLQKVYPFKEGISVVKLKGGYGFINPLGKRLFGQLFEEATSFEKGLSLVKRESSYYLINKRGKRIGDQYDTVNRFGDYFSGRKGNEWTISLTDGNENKNLKFKEVFGGEPNRIHVKTKEGHQFYNAYTKQLASNAPYDTITPWDGDYALMKGENGWGILNSNLKQVIRLDFDSIRQIEFNGKTYFKCYEESGLIKFARAEETQQVGWLMSGQKYKKVEFINEDYFIVCNDKCGVKRHEGTTVLPLEYESISPSKPLTNKYCWPIIVNKEDKWSLRDKKGAVVFDGKKQQISTLGYSYYLVQDKKVSRIINKKGKEIFVLKEKVNFTNYYLAGVFVFENLNGYGFYDKKGILKTKQLYEEIGPFYGVYALVKQGDKYGIIGRSGKMIKKNKYSIKDKNNDFLLLSSDKELVKFYFKGVVE